MEEKKTEGLIGEGVKTLPIGQLLKRIGPGLIATGIVIGPGAVTTAAMLGANYGYALIWLMFPIIFMGITFVMTTNWLAITTSIAIPVAGFFVLLLIWRKDVNEGYKAPTALRICMTISYIFVLIMTVSAFTKTIIPGIAKLFAGG